MLPLGHPLLNSAWPYDCIEVMKYIPRNAIDMILCDLPYGETQNEWDTPLPLDLLWEQYKRVAKPHAAIVLTATGSYAAELIKSNSEMYRYDYVWIKNKKTGFLNANKMPLRQHEYVLVFYRQLPTYNPQKSTGHKPVNSYTKHTSDGTNYGKTQLGVSGGGSTERHPTSVLYFDVVNNDSDGKIHPTQKPIDMFEFLIQTYTNEGDVVLDNCAGSGTTAWACRNTNRHFIVIEGDQTYYDYIVGKMQC